MAFKMAIGGKKPIPAHLIDPAVYKKSNAELENRKNMESKLKSSARLTCPKYLSDAAKKEWRRVIKLYRGLEVDILSDLDVSALVIYCEAWSIYRKAQETWAKYTQVVAANPEAQRVLDKCFNIMEKQSKTISSVSEQLCLTPVGRARMGIMGKKDDEESAIDKLFNDDEDDDD